METLNTTRPRRIVPAANRGCCLFLHVACLLLGASMIGSAEELKSISLPPPASSGGRPLMDTLWLRKSDRSFDARAIPLQKLGDVLWAGFGINRPTESRRTAPSAMNSQEIDLYVALPEGLFLYEPAAHQLAPVLNKDVRHLGGQAFSKEAAAVLFFIADLARLERAKEADRMFYAAFDAGVVSQNIYLYCASENLATVVHELNRGPLQEVLPLRSSQKIIFAQALGYPKPAQAADAQRWTPLFNGKDLSGWTVKCQPRDAQKTFWSVQNGELVCDSVGHKDHNYVWLLSEKEYGNFELRLQFQAFRDSPGNSGLQFRSRYDPSSEGGWLDGPQVDIHPPASMSWRTGFIYDETREERRWVFPSLRNWDMPAQLEPAQHTFKYADDGDGWNELVLLCDGMRVTTKLNGLVRADWDAARVLDNAAHRSHNVGRRGHFALQLHSGDELRIRFREIKIREF